MSTRAIRKVIEAYNRGAALELGVASEARAELDAIKKAAKDLAAWLNWDGPKGAALGEATRKGGKALEFFESIASEAAQ